MFYASLHLFGFHLGPTNHENYAHVCVKFQPLNNLNPSSHNPQFNGFRRALLKKEKKKKKRQNIVY